MTDALPMLTIGGFASLAMILAIVLRPLLAEGHAFIQRTPKWQRVVLGVFLAVAVAFGGGKTNTVGQTSSTNNGAIERSEIGVVLPASSPLVTNLTTALFLSGPRSSFLTSDEDVASPLRVASSLAESAAMVRNINLRGAWDDTFRLAFDADWVFPYGTNHLGGVQVDTQGKVRPWWNATNAIASLGIPLAIVPGLTAFACERTTNNSYLVSWERGAANRDTNTLVTAAIELFRNGDTRVMTNGVVRFTPREIPFPHDGFGQDADWVRANFMNLRQLAPALTNAEEILAVGYPNWVDDCIGIDLTNGLYKFTATFTSAPPEATQLTVGEWTVCVTNAGEYVFLLEKGIEYAFNTDPFDVSVEFSMQDDVGPEAEIVYPSFYIFNSPFSILSSWWDGGDYGEWSIDGGWRWIDAPWIGWAGCCLWMPMLRGSPDVTHLGPDDFPMTFTAVLTDFCRTNEPSFHWTCDNDNIHIASPYARSTEVHVDSLPSWDRVSFAVTAFIGNETLTSKLRTHYGTNETPRISASVGCQPVMFVNDDHRPERFYKIGIRFSCEVATNGHFKVFHDGDAGAELYSDRGTNRIDLLDQDFSFEASAEYSFYVACTNCGSGLFSVECTTADCDIIALTNGYRVIEPVCPLVSTEIDMENAGSFINPACLTCGEQSRIRVGVARGEFASSAVNWTVQGSALVRTNGWDLLVTPVSTDDVLCVCASFNDDVLQPILAMPVVSKRRIPIRGFIVSHPADVDVDAGALDVMVMWANTVYRQVGIEFFVTNVIFDVGTTNLWDLAYAKWVETGGVRKQMLSDEAMSLLDTYDAGDCIEVYLVGSLRKDEMSGRGLSAAAFWSPKGIVVGRNCSTSLAHELGHALGLADCYGSVSGTDLPGLKDPVSALLFNDRVLDFYDEASGRGFYRVDETSEVILKRLLMYGISDGGGSDIPAGNVIAFPDMESPNPIPASIGVGYSGIYVTNEEVYSK